MQCQFNFLMHQARTTVLLSIQTKQKQKHSPTTKKRDHTTKKKKEPIVEDWRLIMQRISEFRKSEKPDQSKFTWKLNLRNQIPTAGNSQVKISFKNLNKREGKNTSGDFVWQHLEPFASCTPDWSRRTSGAGILG